jgi:hypothetical protein
MGQEGTISKVQSQEEGKTNIEADGSRASKRFVLPYEPEATAHPSNQQTSRTAKLQLRSRVGESSPPITPELSPSDWSAGEKNLQSALIIENSMKDSPQLQQPFVASTARRLNK